MTPSILAGLCVWTEARGESQDGRAAVAQVIKNRTVLRYESDGTLQGTVLAPSQFDAFWFGYEGGVGYHRVCHTEEDALARAEQILKSALGDPSLKACQDVFDAVAAGTYRAQTEAFSGVTGKTVLFLNPQLVRRPAWASLDKRDAVIGQVEFYHA